ncbi:hypothetical protein [Candidatus Palauibacter soopunensis]|uniref:restriction endonuclease subunit S n=1 Tax=Candidatus Palauibacter soopunensis TaxID=3056739 RepID=UPI0023880A5A|nr:hypothetical protein [Candidatus Palauibacter soopunensis]MDE2877913.1 hypothetical protein [Candidatus Palauibacter soopunensis]
MQDLVSINPARIQPDLEDRTPLVFVPMPKVAEDFRGIDVSGRRPFSSIKRGYTQFRPGDVLFAKITPCMENGKIAIVPEIQPPLGYGSTEFFVMRPRADGLDRWIAYSVARSSFRQLARENMQGAVGQRRVPKVWLEDASIPLAPLPEQHRIVAKIESLFARLDEGVAALKRAEANLERYRASVLKAAVEGRLTEEWRRENPPTETGEDLLRRILAERRKHWEAEQLAKFKAKGRKPPRNWKAKYKEPVAPDTSGLPELPEGWCWATVDQVSAVTGGLTKNPSRSRLPIRYPYLRVANVYADEIRLDDVRTIGVSEKELDRVLLRSGDLLVVEGNGSADQIGRVAQWQGDLAPCCHQNHLIKVRCPISACRSRWMLLWLLSPLGRRTVLAVASSTSGLHTLSLSKVRALPVPLAPMPEQACAVRLADALSDAARVVQGQIEAEAGIKVSALRQSILKRAFEGRLVPQDPADEPASVLLERIRAERAVERKRRKRRAIQRKRQPKSRVP